MIILYFIVFFVVTLRVPSSHDKNEVDVTGV